MNIFEDFAANMATRVAEHDARMADDPEYARRERERENMETAQRAADATRAAAKERHAAKRWLMQMGVPVKDVEVLSTAGALRDTAALNIARGWWAGDSTCLVLSGTRGCGKTTAAAWCVAQPPREDPYRARDAWLRGAISPRAYRSPLFLDVSKLQRASRYDEERMLDVEMAATLAIDDLGMEYADAKGSFAALFDALFNVRYADQLKTVITTNLTAVDFKARYGERVADRIRECGVYIELDEQSLRGRVETRQKDAE